jgi:sigma-E factor negative regulatory protein RseC
MLREEGIVIAVKGDRAQVEARPKSACGSCSARSGCGTSLVASLFPRRGHNFIARNCVGAKPGDRVFIGLDESVLQRASLMIYLLPLLGLIGGALAGLHLARLLGSSDGELLSILLGGAGMAAVLFWIRLHSYSLGGRKGRFEVEILEVIPSAPITTLTIDKQAQA